MAGARADHVRQAVGKKFSLTPTQVEQLLANRAGPLVGLMEHQTAFTLRTELQQLGLDCRIAPVPRSNLGNGDQRIALQGIESERRVGHPPRTIRASRQANSMRSGKAISPVQPRSSRSLLANLPSWVRVAAVLVVALVIGFSLQTSRETQPESIVAADTSH